MTINTEQMNIQSKRISTKFNRPNVAFSNFRSDRA